MSRLRGCRCGFNRLLSRLRRARGLITIEESYIPDSAELAAARADAELAGGIHLSQGGVGDVAVAVEGLGLDGVALAAKGSIDVKRP